MNLDNDFLHFLKVSKSDFFLIYLNSTDELRVTIQENDNEMDKSSLLTLNVPEIKIDNMDFDSANIEIEDLQQEWELEDCEDLEYEFYEQEISEL